MYELETRDTVRFPLVVRRRKIQLPFGKRTRRFTVYRAGDWVQAEGRAHGTGIRVVCRRKLLDSLVFGKVDPREIDRALARRAEQRRSYA